MSALRRRSLPGQHHWLLHLSPGAAALLRNAGSALIVLGALTLAFAYGAMARARTTINPRIHTRTIVTRGIYRFSRDPIYMGWFVFLLGGGLRNGSLFQVLVAALMIVLLHWAVGLKEEKYLENAFGEEYLRYKRNVRRWL